MNLFTSGNFLLRSYAFIVLGIVLIALLLESVMATRAPRPAGGVARHPYSTVCPAGFDAVATARR